MLLLLCLKEQENMLIYGKCWPRFIFIPVLYRTEFKTLLQIFLKLLMVCAHPT